MTNEGLFLKIDRVVQGECETCQALLESYEMACIVGLQPPSTHIRKQEDCPACHGSGSVNVRVRGMVEVEVSHDDGDEIFHFVDGEADDSCRKFWERKRCEHKEKYGSWLHPSYSSRPSREQVVEYILTAFLNHKLPASLLQSDTNPDGLREVEM